MAGMIIRRLDGSVMFTAYMFLFNCNDDSKVKIHALMQSMALAIQYTEAPIIVQSDSLEALATLSWGGLTRSLYGHLVAEIKYLMEKRIYSNEV